MGELDSKIALVTGAGQGVGQGIALALAAAGASILVAGRTVEKLESTVSMITERGGKAAATICNVKDVDDLERVVSECVRKFGGLHILINKAQEVPLGTLDQITDEAFTAGFESASCDTSPYEDCVPAFERRWLYYQSREHCSTTLGHGWVWSLRCC